MSDILSNLDPILASEIALDDLMYFVDVSKGENGSRKLSIEEADKRWGAGAPIVAKGDLIVGSASGVSGILSVGGDGQALVADSNEALGVKWFDLAGVYGNVYGPGSSTDSNIALYSGTTGQLLKDDGKAIVTTIGSPGTDDNIPTEAAVRAAISAGGAGDVSGPASSVDNRIAIFSGTSGKLIEDNGFVTISSTVMTGHVDLELKPSTPPVDNEGTPRSTKRLIVESYDKSNSPNGHAGDGIQLIWKDNQAKNFIGWWDGTGGSPELKAWVGTHYLSNDGLSTHQHFSIEVADLAGAMQTRFAIPYGLDITPMEVHSATFAVNGPADYLTYGADFKVAGANSTTELEGDLIVGRNITSEDITMLGDSGESRLLWLDTTSTSDYAATLRLTGESGSSYRGLYMQYDANGNQSVIGTHDANDTNTASDVELITISRDGENVNFVKDIAFDEAADHSSTPVAGKGYLWVKNTAPCTLIFTDDTGADITLGGSTATDISIADAGGYYTGTNVEAALQEIGAGSVLDSRYVEMILIWAIILFRI